MVKNGPNILNLSKSFITPPWEGAYKEFEWSRLYLVSEWLNCKESKGGVYIIIKKEHGMSIPIYIGQSKYISSRIYRHTRGYHSHRNEQLRNYLNNNVCFYTFTNIKLTQTKDTIERELIAKYQPEYNRMSGKAGRLVRKMSFHRCMKKEKSMSRTIMMFLYKQKDAWRYLYSDSKELFLVTIYGDLRLAFWENNRITIPVYDNLFTQTDRF
jgi:hypothetical protein